MDRDLDLLVAAREEEALRREEWVWMPHAGHLIVGAWCRFHLATKAGGYIVSTVGEYWPDRQVRAITAEIRGVTIEGRGDAWDADYMRKLGYEEIGAGRTYETMVFPAREDAEHGCCPWTAADWQEVDFDGYSSADDAMRGHMAMCEKWAVMA